MLERDHIATKNEIHRQHWAFQKDQRDKLNDALKRYREQCQKLDSTDENVKRKIDKAFIEGYSEYSETIINLRQELRNLDAFQKQLAYEHKNHLVAIRTETANEFGAYELKCSELNLQLKNDIIAIKNQCDEDI